MINEEKRNKTARPGMCRMEENMRKKFLRNVSAAAVVSAAVLAVGGCGGSSGQAETSAVQTEASTEAAEEESSAVPETKEDENGAGTESVKNDQPSENHKAYLKEYFEVEVGENPDAASFLEDLKKVAGDEIPPLEGELTWASAVQAAVSAADYEELALSYPKEKTTERLKAHGIGEGDVEEAYQAALACALDVSLISEEDGKRAAAGEGFTAADEERLLMKVAEANGDGRNYLGRASQPEIYGKLDQAWNSFIIFDDGQLSQVGKEAVEQQVSTGYGIKSAAYNARFLPELTLQYGHSDIKHAHQLIGLLNSEDIDAKVQLEPKISIYQYLLEWGPVPEATPTYEVKQFGDLYLVYAVEYDLMLEFDNTEDMLRFDSVINDFAKKNEGNEEAVGLIYGSWWQPLYSTTRTDMPEDAYHQMFDCVVTNGIYSIHPFALPENKDFVIEKLKEMSDGLEVEAVERYCNTAFYHYLKGEDYQ